MCSCQNLTLLRYDNMFKEANIKAFFFKKHSWFSSGLNYSYPNISMHIFLSVFHKFPTVPTGRI